MKVPQLSLRELFLLVALVAMGCGWWVDRSRQTERYNQLNYWVRHSNGVDGIPFDSNGEVKPHPRNRRP